MCCARIIVVFALSVLDITKSLVIIKLHKALVSPLIILVLKFLADKFLGSYYCVDFRQYLSNLQPLMGTVPLHLSMYLYLSVYNYSFNFI